MGEGPGNFNIPPSHEAEEEIEKYRTSLMSIRDRSQAFQHVVGAALEKDGKGSPSENLQLFYALGEIEDTAKDILDSLARKSMPDHLESFVSSAEEILAEAQEKFSSQ